MDTKLRVLVVEDGPSWQVIAREALAPYATVVIAASVSAAMKELTTNANFCLVILDGRVPRFDNEPLSKLDTTLVLAMRIVERYKIPAYSASSDDDLNEKLAQIGCIRTNKRTAIQQAKEALIALNTQ